MTLSELIRRIKRRTGYGSLSVTNDQATQDILDGINDNMDEGWMAHNWSFSLNSISIAHAADTSDYTLSSDDGHIIVLYDSVTLDPLKRYDLRNYINRAVKTINASGVNTDGVHGYHELGRDSSDRLKIRLIGTPSKAGNTTIGFSKKRLTPLTTSDLSSEIPFWPREVHRIFVFGGLSHVRDIQEKYTERDKAQALFEAKINRLWGREKSAPDRQITIGLPAMIVRRKRARGGTRVA